MLVYDTETIQDDESYKQNRPFLLVKLIIAVIALSIVFYYYIWLRLNLIGELKQQKMEFVERTSLAYEINNQTLPLMFSFNFLKYGEAGIMTRIMKMKQQPEAIMIDCDRWIKIDPQNANLTSHQ